MKKKLLTLNHSILFLCTSIYLGTGISLVFFSFPVADDLTPDNYYSHFVPQVEAATQFFTYMTIVMMVTGLVMTIAEWKGKTYRWYPIVVLIGVAVATGLTTQYIFPYNELMSNGITDNTELHEVLGKWMSLNRMRVGLWAVQWLSMMTYFGLIAYRSEES